MPRKTEDLLEELREVLNEQEQLVSPDEYYKAVGSCPPTWNHDSTTNKCVQVRPGPRRFRLPSDAETPDKAAAKASEPKPEPEKPVPPPTGSIKPIEDEPKTPTGSGHPYAPDPRKLDKDGVGVASRVGLCGKCLNPPPGIPRLPNLTRKERAAEEDFASKFEANPNKVAREYYEAATAQGGITFSTDDAKLLSDHYNPEGSDEENKKARAELNLAVHQTANAIAKRAFLTRLDALADLPEDDPMRAVLVTSGGVASGKGFALRNSPEAADLQRMAGAIWDAAGEQFATENPWILEECRKRGLRPVFAYVDADPRETWAGGARGVVSRAQQEGRMVDARLHSESYELGAQNFKAFYDKNKDEVDFVILSSRGSPPSEPRALDDFPEEALRDNAEELTQEAIKKLEALRGEIDDSIIRGGTIGKRVW